MYFVKKKKQLIIIALDLLSSTLQLEYSQFFQGESHLPLPSEFINYLNQGTLCLNHKINYTIAQHLYSSA